MHNNPRGVPSDTRLLCREQIDLMLRLRQQLLLLSDGCVEVSRGGDLLRSELLGLLECLCALGHLALGGLHKLVPGLAFPGELLLGNLLLPDLGNEPVSVLCEGSHALCQVCIQLSRICTEPLNIVDLRIDVVLLARELLATGLQVLRIERAREGSCEPHACADFRALGITFTREPAGQEAHSRGSQTTLKTRFGGGADLAGCAGCVTQHRRGHQPEGATPETRILHLGPLYVLEPSRCRSWAGESNSSGLIL